MRRDRLLHVSDAWFRLLLRLYPPDFRDEMGEALVETYRDRASEALDHGSAAASRLRLAGVWLAALWDSLRNGPGERLHPAVSWRRGGDWGRDLERVGRRFRRSPVFVAATLGTLTVGLGAFAVVYTAVDKVLIEPLPYSNPDDLYFVWRDDTAYSDGDRNGLSGPDIVELQQAGGVIEDAAALRVELRTLSASGETNPPDLTTMLVSPNLFDLLGVAPALGRGFAPEEAGPDRPPVIVLNDALWRRLGGDPAIIGAEVELSEERYTVVGVMPPDFRLAGQAWWAASPRRADLYVPFDFDLADEDPGDGDFTGLIRARRGSSPEAVAAAVDGVGRLLDERHNQSRGRRYYPTGLQADLVAPIRPALIALGFAGVFLLLVLAVNLASLLLARAADREREFAVSRALGANGLAVVRAIVLEGGLLGLFGGLLGAAAGIWGTRLIVAVAPLDLPRREEIVLDWGTGAVVVAVGVLLGLSAAAAPAAWASRASLTSLLGRSAVRGGGRSSRLRGGLIVAQVALSLVLLSAGGLVVRNFERLLAVDPGFRSEGVLTFHLTMAPRLFTEPADAFAFQDRVEASLRALPGVTGVSATSALPLGSSASLAEISIPGAPGNTGDAERDSTLVNTILIRAGYVEAMGMRLLDGRTFGETRRDDVREALIDRRLAERFFPTGSPLGATIPFGRAGGSLTVVGVVEQARLDDIHQDGRPQLFIRSEDWGPFGQPYFVVVRTEREPQSLIPEVRAAIGRIDSRVPLSQMRTMDEIVADARSRERLSAVLIAGFALGALLLVAMGLFGVVSRSVTRRRGELAVRCALGATPGRVLRLVLGEGARLIVLGLVIGIPGIYLSGRAIRGILVEVSPYDGPTLVAVGIGLVAVALLVCYLAARRVTAIEPSALLREEG
ncbi:MAG TPA: ADOP family duplicated permease [Gammaproteobacteria bacterium]